MKQIEQINTENILTTENTEKSPLFVIARSRQLKANKIHFQFSTFNFQLISDCFAMLAMTVKGNTMTALVDFQFIIHNL
jgi:hypothetical protein